MFLGQFAGSMPKSISSKSIKPKSLLPSWRHMEGERKHNTQWILCKGKKKSKKFEEI